MTNMFPEPRGATARMLVHGIFNVGKERCEIPRILSALASYFEKMVASNDKRVLEIDEYGSRTLQITVFHGLRAPSISIRKYLERIFKYANCSPSCFVVAYVYLDRFIHQRPGLPITSLNIHRLLVSSVMVAAKFLDDAFYNNAYYAKVGGVSSLEMNRLELEFLFTLRFQLHVTIHAFENYCVYLEREVAFAGPHHVEKVLRTNWESAESNGIAPIRCIPCTSLAIGVAESIIS